MKAYTIFLLKDVVCKREKGYCVKSNGADQNSGQQKLHSQDVTTTGQQQECLRLCREIVGAKGCEGNRDNIWRGCYAHTQEVARGSGTDDKFWCWILSKCYEGNFTLWILEAV